MDVTYTMQTLDFDVIFQDYGLVIAVEGFVFGVFNGGSISFQGFVLTQYDVPDDYIKPLSDSEMEAGIINAINNQGMNANLISALSNSSKLSADKVNTLRQV